jgi:hypothetical protein
MFKELKYHLPPWFWMTQEPIWFQFYGRHFLLGCIILNFHGHTAYYHRKLNMENSTENPECTVDSIGFWRWCITHRITGFSDFFHRLDKVRKPSNSECTAYEHGDQLKWTHLTNKILIKKFWSYHIKIHLRRKVML